MMAIDLDQLEPLRTQRLRLRGVCPRDAADVSGSITLAVSRWVISWPFPFTQAMAAERNDAARIAAMSGDMLPLIERLRHDLFLGWLGVTLMPGRRGLLGYWLGESHHGHGYMREALSVALPGAFRLLKLGVIEATAQVRNERSLAASRSLGMTTVGERMIFAPARGRDGLCIVLEMRRPDCRGSP